MNAPRLIAASLFFISLSLALRVCHADVPTPEQECRYRNSAVCESGGVQFMVDGPCPSTARIVRPQGQEHCESFAQTSAMSAQPNSNEPAVAPSRTPRQDLAWVGRIERWLLPVLVLVGGLAVVIAVVVVVRRLWQHRDAGDAIPSPARSVLLWVLSAVISVQVAYRVAGFAFQRVFSSFNNHDSAGPMLIAAPVAFVVFLLTWLAAFAVIAFALAWMLKTYRQRQD